MTRSRVRDARGILASCVASLMCLIPVCSVAEKLRPAEAPDDKFEVALQLVITGQCAQAWRQIWEFAEAKDYYAFHLVASLMIGKNVKFSDASQKQLVDLLLPAMFYGTLVTDADEAEVVKSMRKTLAALLNATGLENRKAVASCFVSEQKPEICVNLAIGNRIIPSFDLYMERTAQFNRDVRVDCALPIGTDFTPKE